MIKRTFMRYVDLNRAYSTTSLKKKTIHKLMTNYHASVYNKPKVRIT